MAPRRARREKVARTQVTRTVDERNLEEKKHHTLDSEMEETPGLKSGKQTFEMSSNPKWCSCRRQQEAAIKMHFLLFVSKMNNCFYTRMYFLLLGKKQKQKYGARSYHPHSLVFHELQKVEENLRRGWRGQLHFWKIGNWDQQQASKQPQLIFVAKQQTLAIALHRIALFHMSVPKGKLHVWKLSFDKL